MLPRKFKRIFFKHESFFRSFLEKEKSDPNVNLGQVILVLLFYFECCPSYFIRLIH